MSLLEKINENALAHAERQPTLEELNAYFRTPQGAAEYEKYSQAVTEGTLPVEKPVVAQKSESEIEEERVFTQIELEAAAIMKAENVNKADAYGRLFQRRPDLHRQYNALATSYAGAR